MHVGTGDGGMQKKNTQQASKGLAWHMHARFRSAEAVPRKSDGEGEQENALAGVASTVLAEGTVNLPHMNTHTRIR